MPEKIQLVVRGHSTFQVAIFSLIISAHDPQQSEHIFTSLPAGKITLHLFLNNHDD